MKKKVVIIGGGIGGCLTAIYAAKKGFDVSIYEKSNRIGGILADLTHKKEKYFNGCQYLSAHSKWFKDLTIFNNIKKNLIKFRVTHGSYTYLTKKKKISNDFVGPVFDDFLSNYLLRKSNKKKTLGDRLNFYPKKISNCLKDWISRFEINISDIGWSGAIGLLVSRVNLFNYQNELYQYKKKNYLANELYGLPRNQINFPKLYCALPKNGYDKLFYSIGDVLKANRVKIFINSPVRTNWKKTRLEIVSLGKKIKNDRIIWTGNPTGLIKNFNNKKIQSVHVTIKVVCFDLEKKISKYFYAAVYSKDTSIFKLFIYNLDGKSKITLECFNTNESSSALINKTNEILLDFGIKTKVRKQNPKVVNIQKRYFLVSVYDEKILKDFYKSTNKSNLICGAWDYYLRDNKMEFMRSQLDQIK